MRLFAPLVFLLSAAFACAADFTVAPADVRLTGNFARAQLLVTDADGNDSTLSANYGSSKVGVVTVSPSGQLLGVGNGEASVSVIHSAVARQFTVKVAGVTPEPPVDFSTQVMPILAKAGCNAGACHASQYGKGGFKLSVFGYAPDEDHVAIVRDRFGRRISFADPDRRLFLLKPTSGVPDDRGHHLGS